MFTASDITYIISCYNAAAFYENLTSHLRLFLSDGSKIILCDDGSTDSAINVLSKEIEHENLTIIFNKKNEGLTYSLIRCSHMVNTQLIGRFDVDDILSKKKAKIQLDILNRFPDVAVVGCSYVQLDMDTGKSTRVSVPNQFLKKEDFLVRNPLAHGSILLKKKIFAHVGGYNPKIRYAQDLDLWFRVLQDAKIFVAHEYLIERREYSSSISSRHRLVQAFSALRIRIKHTTLITHKLWALCGFFKTFILCLYRNSVT